MAKRKISGIINATEHPMNLETPWNQKQPDGTYHAYAGDDIEAFLKKELSNRTPTEELVSGETKPPTPNINPKPMNQKRMEPNIKSIRFFISTLAVFLVRINPASTKANPGCMKNTSMAASSIHTVFRPVTISLMASVSVLLTGVSDSASCAQRLAGNRNKSIKSLFRYSFSIPFLLVVSIIFSLKL